MRSENANRENQASKMNEEEDKYEKIIGDLLPEDKTIDQLKSYLMTMDVELDFEKRPKKYYKDVYMQAIKDPERKRKLVKRLRDEIDKPIVENNIQRKRKRNEEDSGIISNNNLFDNYPICNGRRYEQTSELQTKKSIVNTTSNQNSQKISEIRQPYYTQEYRATEEFTKQEKTSNQPTPKVRTNQVYIVKTTSVKSDVISAPRNEEKMTGSNAICRQQSINLKNLDNTQILAPENEMNILDGSKLTFKPSLSNRAINLTESIINTTIDNVDIAKDNEDISRTTCPITSQVKVQVSVHDHSRLQKFLAKIKIYYPQAIKYIFSTAGLGTFFIWLYRRLPVHLRGVNFCDPVQFGIVIFALIGVITFCILLWMIKKNKDLEMEDKKLVADNCYNWIKQALMQKSQDDSIINIEVIESEFIHEYCQANNCTVDNFRINYLPYLKQFINEDESMEEKVEYIEGEFQTRWVIKE